MFGNIHGIDWTGTQATPVIPDFSLFPDDIQPDVKDELSTITDYFTDVSAEPFAVFWLTNSQHDMLLIPAETRGLYDVAHLVNGNLQRSRSGQSQLQALQAAIDFASEFHLNLDLLITDRQMVPFNCSALADHEPAETRRKNIVRPTQTTSFVLDSNSIFPQPYYPSHSDQYGNEIVYGRLERALREFRPDAYSDHLVFPLSDTTQ